MPMRKRFFCILIGLGCMLAGVVGVRCADVIPMLDAHSVAHVVHAALPTAYGAQDNVPLFLPVTYQTGEEFALVGPPSVSLGTYQTAFCQPRHGKVSDACPHTPQMYNVLVDAGIDPVFEMAFAAKETEFGITGPGRSPQRNIHGIVCNSWDGGTCDGPYHLRFSAYSSYVHAVEAWAKLILERGTYVDAGNTTVAQILPIYAPSFENDTQGYIAQVQSWVRNWRSWDGIYQGPSVPLAPQVWKAHAGMPPVIVDDPLYPDDFVFADEGEPEVANPAPVMDDPLVPERAIALDNSQRGFSANQNTWDSVWCGLNGEHLVATSTSVMQNSASRASWLPDSLEPGVYEVQVYVPVCGIAEATRSAHYVVTHDAGRSMAIVDQQAHVGQWVSLGMYFFGARLNPMIEISDLTEDDERDVRVDAVVWIRQRSVAPIAKSVYQLIRMASGDSVQWNGLDMQEATVHHSRVPFPEEPPTLTPTLTPQPTPTLMATATLTPTPTLQPTPTMQSATVTPLPLTPVLDLAFLTLTPTLDLASPMYAIGVVSNGGNLRTEPHIVPETVIAQVCPGDEVAILERTELYGHLWLYVRMVQLAADCVPDRAVVDTEGWVSSTLVEQ